MLVLPAAKTSVLVLLTDPDSQAAMRATGALAIASARPGEQLYILSDHSGATLASSQAPPSLSMPGPMPPTPLPPDPTSFQKARHSQAVRHYQIMLRTDLASLRRQQQAELTTWVKLVVAEADARPVLQRAQNGSIATALGVAASDLFSLRQAGLGYGGGTVIAVLTVDDATVSAAPSLPSGLQGSSVVVSNFPGNIEEQAAWQSSLAQSGAARTVVLTPDTDGQLLTVVRQGLDGAVSDTLTSVLFALGQHQFQAAAVPLLRQLLYLLTAKYPHATATINGYTDSLPAPGGNLQLSLLRARAVEDWLVVHGVAATRLQDFGYGDTDPVAPNTHAGQPLNRRVVVVIDPAVPG
jgi:outer membrane protein OmpA-like peptidoglycan-associated protein